MDVESNSSLSLLDSSYNPKRYSASPSRRRQGSVAPRDARVMSSRGVATGGGGTFGTTNDPYGVSPQRPRGLSINNSDDVLPPATTIGLGERSWRAKAMDTIHRMKWALFATGICLLFVIIGVILLYGGYSPHTGRFFLAAGLYGLAGAFSNYVAVRFLLHNAFIARNEQQFKRAIRSIVMNLFFDRETIEAELVDHVRKVLGTFSLKKNLQSVFESESFDGAIDKKLYQFAAGPDGMMLAMLGIPATSLKPLVTPVILSLAADLSPILEDVFTPENVVTADRLTEALHHVVTDRIQALTLDDVRSVLKGVLLPHVAAMVLWGSLFGGLVGVATEIVQVSKFMHSFS